MRHLSQLLSSLAVGLGLGATVATAQDFDRVILHGRVMDPETKLDAMRNVGVNDGRIAVITEEKIAGRQTIDAAGLVVAPGFIDTQFHGMDPYGHKLGLRDGVTTALELEAGAYPVEDFYNQFKDKAQLNYGASVSHIWARMAVLDHVNPKGLGLYGTALKDSLCDGAHWNTKSYDSKDQAALNAAVEDCLKQGGLGIGFAIGCYTIVGRPDVMDVASLARSATASSPPMCVTWRSFPPAATSESKKCWRSRSRMVFPCSCTMCPATALA